MTALRIDPKIPKSLLRGCPALGLSLLLWSGAACAQGSAPAPLPAPSAVAAAAAPPPPAWPAIHRFTAGLRPFGSPADGGVMMDLAYEYINDLDIGFELTPIVIGKPAISQFAGRMKLGYGGKWFGAALAFGSGYPAFFPELGPVFRVGKLNGVYASLRLSWVLYPTVRPPADGSLELRIPVHRRVALRLDGYGGYAATYPFLVYGTLGTGIILRGQGLIATTILNVGAGGVYFGTLGGMGLVGVEHRL